MRAGILLQRDGADTALLHAVLGQLEILFLEAENQTVQGVGDGDRDENEVGVRLEDGHRTLFRIHGT